MKIIVDAMGGDNAPQSAVMGAIQANREYGVNITLVGRGEDILRTLEANGIKDLPSGVEVVHASEVVEMCDDPANAFRKKKDSSLTVGLNLLKDSAGDAFVSAGSTGALLSGATLVTKRIKGIRRAALAPVVPTGGGGSVLIDCGANAECPPEYLLQFAYMGSYYAREAVQGAVDVIVADGYSGNIFLKALEGTALFMGGEIKKLLMKNLRTKLAAGLISGELREFKKIVSAEDIGGTALLGISKAVIKAHGSSNEKAVKNAIRQARDVVESGIIQKITDNVELMRLDPAAGKTEG